MTNQLPYRELELLGLSRQTVDSMPEQLKSSITCGELTPLISVKSDMGEGMKVLMPFKLQMHQDADGRQRMLVYPMSKEMVNSVNLSNENFRDLQSGNIIKVNGKFLQRDPETNSIVEKPERQLDLDRKIAEMEKVRDIELGLLQKNQLKEGKPVELDVGGEKVTVGIDLRDKDHFRTLNGDMQEWQRQKEIDYDILHPEFVGYVQTDENRWEQQIFSREGFNSKTLKERPAQTRSGSMKL